MSVKCAVLCVFTVRTYQCDPTCMHVSDVHCAVCYGFVYADQCDHMHVSVVYSGVS